MAHSSPSQSLISFARNFKRLNASDPLTRCLIPRLNRTFATAVDVQITEAAIIPPIESLSASPSPSSSSTGCVLTTLYSWPELEPRRFERYSSQQLDLPLRRDILHRAVIYEGDNQRGWSTASTKWRGDVHGSNRKIAPQKGLGAARVGDKKSPIRRGGGVAFGPHPRDFATELPRKIYDIAWRTALSYRYRKGELIVLDNAMELPLDATPRLLENIFVRNRWDHTNGRTLLVASRVNPAAIKAKVLQSSAQRELEPTWKTKQQIGKYANMKTEVIAQMEEFAARQQKLFENMEHIGRHGTIKDLNEINVKDLLETGRVVIDRASLHKLFRQHSSDYKH